MGNKLYLLVVLSSTPKRGRLKEHLLSPCVLMLTTIQSSALTLPKMCRKPTPKESSRKVEPNASFHCWPEVPVPGPVLPLGTSGAQFRSHCRLFFPGTGTVSSPEIWTGSRTGSTGPPEVPVNVAVVPLSTSGGNFRRHFRLFFQVLDVLESPGF